MAHQQNVQQWVDRANEVIPKLTDPVLQDHVRQLAATSIRGCDLQRTLDDYFKIRRDLELAVDGADIPQQVGRELDDLMKGAPDAILNSILVCADEAVRRG